MATQVSAEVERKLKSIGMIPAQEIKEDAVIAQVSGTQYRIISNLNFSTTISAASRSLEQAITTGAVVFPKKNVSELFPAYPKLLEAINELPENIDEIYRKTINEKIEDVSTTLKTITRNITENVSSSEKLTTRIMSVSTTQKKVNLNRILSSPSEFAEYRGKYVALEDGEIVGSGKTSIEALTEARRGNPERKISLKLLSDTDIGL
jgi:hypothetical protein